MRIMMISRSIPFKEPNIFESKFFDSQESFPFITTYYKKKEKKKLFGRKS